MTPALEEILADALEKIGCEFAGGCGDPVKGPFRWSRLELAKDLAAALPFVTLPTSILQKKE